MPDRRLGVTIAADAANFIRGLRDAGQATKTLRGDLDQLSVATKTNAQAQVAATVKKTQRLRDEIVAYKAVGAAAVQGSREQVAAANLAANAERRLASSLGVTSRESRALAISAHGVERDVSRAGRGALAGAGAFSHLGRSVAFASSWFLGGVGFVAGAKASINAASGLEEQVQRTGAVFGSSAGGVKKWSETSVKSLGLSKAAALDASDTIGTLLQNVGVAPAKGAAMSETFVQLAADMAAFKKVDPSVSLNALEAGLAGRTRGLKQFGLVIDTTTVKAEALSDGILKSSKDIGKIRDLQAKVQTARTRVQVETVTHGAGSVQAVSATIQLHNAQRELGKAVGGTTGQLTAQQRTLATYNVILKQTAAQRGAFAADAGQLSEKELVFHAALVNTEAAIGNALLPTVSKYTGQLGDWLSKSENQAKVERDVQAAVKLVSDAVGIATPIVKTAAGVANLFADAVGGDAHALEGLAGAFAIFKVTKFIQGLEGVVVEAAVAKGAVTSIGTASTVMGAETVAGAAVAETALVGVGTTATGVLAQIGGLGTALKGLGVLAAPLLFLASSQKSFKDFKQVPQKGSPMSKIGRSVFEDKQGRFFEQKAIGRGVDLVPITRDQAIALGAKIKPAKAPRNLLPALGSSQSKADARLDNVLGISPAQAKADRKAFETAPMPGKPGKPAPSPFTPSQQTELALATSPDSVPLLQSKVKDENATLAWLKRRRANGKITNAAYIQEVTGILNDRASTIAQIAAASKKAEGTFTLPGAIQVEQAKAATTATMADDVKAEKDAKSFAQHVIASGKLKGDALAAAWNAIATADQTISSVAKTVPMALQVKQALAQTTPGNEDDAKVALEIRTWEQHLIKSQHLKGQALIDALGVITTANQSIGQFIVPWKITLGAAEAALTKSTADDIRNAKALKAYALKEIASKKLSRQGWLDALAAEDQANQILGAAPSKSIKLVSGKDIVRGMSGLSKAEKIQIEQRYDQAAAHGGRRPTGVGVLGQTVVISGPIHVHGVQDVDKFASELDKRARRRVVQTRGHTAGNEPH